MLQRLTFTTHLSHGKRWINAAKLHCLGYARPVVERLSGIAGIIFESGNSSRLASSNRVCSASLERDPCPENRPLDRSDDPPTMDSWAGPSVRAQSELPAKILLPNLFFAATTRVARPKLHRSPQPFRSVENAIVRVMTSHRDRTMSRSWHFGAGVTGFVGFEAPSTPLVTSSRSHVKPSDADSTYFVIVSLECPSRPHLAWLGHPFSLKRLENERTVTSQLRLQRPDCDTRTRSPTQKDSG
jgi:hypothetical protein